MSFRLQTPNTLIEVAFDAEGGGRKKARKSKDDDGTNKCVLTVMVGLVANTAECALSRCVFKYTLANSCTAACMLQVQPGRQEEIRAGQDVRGDRVSQSASCGEPRTLHTAREREKA